MTVYSIERQKPSDQVTALLEDEIVRGVRHVGEQLRSEREMMRQFGVGRPTIREALFALDKKGLVQVVGGTRARVTKPTLDVIVAELSGAARHLLEQPGGQQHFQEARAFFETGLARPTVGTAMIPGDGSVGAGTAEAMSRLAEFPASLPMRTGRGRW